MSCCGHGQRPVSRREALKRFAIARYNAYNELTSQDGVAYNSVSDGNLLSGGTHSYTWNARGELASISGATT